MTRQMKKGDRMEDEGEFAAPDWRVRAGPRNKPSQREREEHEATHMSFRDWCVHCMMGRGRTHHHIAKQKSEDESRRPIIAMDYFFMKLESTTSAQSIPEESITCVADKEDRHQNIMSSVASKKGVEEPWAVERVVKFIDLLGYREITLKSDTEPAKIAFRNRVAALCKAEVTTEDAVKGDKESNGLIENAVMLLRGIIRTIKCHIESRTQEPLGDESPVIPWLVEHAGCARKVVMERRHLKGSTGKKPPQEFVPFGEKVLARRVTTEPRNRMNPRYGSRFGHGLPVLISNWAFIARHPSDIKGTASMACPPIYGPGSSCHNMLASLSRGAVMPSRGPAGRLQARGTRTHQEYTRFASLGPACSQGFCFEIFPSHWTLQFCTAKGSTSWELPERSFRENTDGTSHRPRLSECRTLPTSIFVFFRYDTMREQVSRQVQTEMRKRGP